METQPSELPSGKNDDSFPEKALHTRKSIYVFVVQIHGEGQNNGIVSSETEDFTLASDPLNIHHVGHFYNPQMEEFIVVLRENTDGNTLYRINPKGEIQPFTLD